MMIQPLQQIKEDILQVKQQLQHGNASEQENAESKPNKIGNFQIDYDKLLGEGSFSRVYKGNDIRCKNMEVAIKIINKLSLNPDLKKLIDSQIKIIRLINHENIVKCYQILQDETNIYIIMQICNQGDLQSRIDSYGPIQEAEATSIIKGVFKGLLYLSQINIIHRDIKVANIFMHNEKPKIADFGFAIHNKSLKQFQDISIGSPIYMSPQGIKHNVYGPTTDVWAFGIFVYQILHGKTPYSHCTKQKQLKYSISNPLNWNSLKSNLSYSIKQIILKCLQVNYQKRIRFDKLKQHQFFKTKSNRSSIIVYELMNAQNIKYENNLVGENTKYDSIIENDTFNNTPFCIKSKDRSNGDNQNSCQIQIFEAASKQAMKQDSSSQRTPYLLSFNSLNNTQRNYPVVIIKDQIKLKSQDKIGIKQDENKSCSMQQYRIQEKPHYQTQNSNKRYLQVVTNNINQNILGQQRSKSKQTPRTRVSLQKIQQYQNYPNNKSVKANFNLYNQNSAAKYYKQDKKTKKYNDTKQPLEKNTKHNNITYLKTQNSQQNNTYKLLGLYRNKYPQNKATDNIRLKTQKNKINKVDHSYLNDGIIPNNYAHAKEYQNKGGYDKYFNYRNTTRNRSPKGFRGSPQLMSSNKIERCLISPKRNKNNLIKQGIQNRINKNKNINDIHTPIQSKHDYNSIKIIKKPLRDHQIAQKIIKINNQNYKNQSKSKKKHSLIIKNKVIESYKINKNSHDFQSIDFPASNVNCYFYLIHFSRLIYKLSCNLSVNHQCWEIKSGLQKNCLELLYYLKKKLIQYSNTSISNKVNNKKTPAHKQNQQSLAKIQKTIQNYINQYQIQFHQYFKVPQNISISKSNSKLLQQLNKILSEQLKSTGPSVNIKLLYLGSVYLFHFKQIYQKYFKIQTSKYWYEYNLKLVIKQIQNDISISNISMNLQSYLNIKRKLTDRNF